MPDAAKTFGEDLEFLSRHYPVDVISNAEGAKLVCIAALQGRTMTSSSNGDTGQSNGYINYDAFEQGMVDPQINLFGGEDRIWISPEGGQFSVFFDPDVDMSFANWRTPPCIDSEAFELVDRQTNWLTYEKTAAVTNRTGFTFEFKLRRKVILLSRSEVAAGLGIEIPDSVAVVGHEAQNTITNAGDDQWKPETGLIGLWTLCMNPPSPNAVLIVPFKKGSTDQLGEIVTADYFGKLSDDRFHVSEELGLVFLKGDGNFRSKLGIGFNRACSRMGSWNPETGILSVVEFNLPSEVQNGYTNNLWEYQDRPLDGDVINAYNDGPNDSGGKLGGFFELETISPALALKPGESFTHTPRTVRIEGTPEALDKIALAIFGTGIEHLESALKTPQG